MQYTIYTQISIYRYMYLSMYRFFSLCIFIYPYIHTVYLNKQADEWKYHLRSIIILLQSRRTRDSTIRAFSYCSHTLGSILFYLMLELSCQSVRGPLLFHLFINSMLQSSSLHTTQELEYGQRSLASAPPSS